MHRLLIVEDRKKLLASLRRGLEEEGYEIDELTGDLRETELGLVGNDACQMEFDGSKLEEQLESLCDRAAAKGFDVQDWLQGWSRSKRTTATGKRWAVARDRVTRFGRSPRQ